MKNNFIVLVLLLPLCLFGQKNKVLFNDNWEFQHQPTDPVAIVSLPHTPRIEPLVMKEQFLGEVTYRKHFDYPLKNGRQLFIHFEGAMHTARVLLNGQEMGKHIGGYLPFKVDLTTALKDSNNILVVYLDNREDPTIPPGKPIKDLDFYYHAGIYRNVWLEEIGGIEIENTFFQTLHADAKNAELQLDFDLHFDPSWIISPLEVKASIGKSSFELNNTQYIDSSSVIHYQGKLIVNQPELWSPDSPILHEIQILAILASDTIAKQSFKAGIREAIIKSDGFYLNGSKLFLSGTNRHQEYPYVGYAVADNAHKRDAQLIKDAGFNFVRLSHYPQAPAFYDACDELGLIVMDAIAGWQFFGPAPFEQRCKEDLKNMILRDRNHPSVIFWENSLNETQMSDLFIQDMNHIAKELLGSTAFTAGWIDHPSYDVFIPARQHAKAPDYWNLYTPKAKALLIAEYGDWEYYAQNAGFNQTQFADLAQSERNSRHLRSASEKALLQQAYNFKEASLSNRKGEHIIGEANWVCFDYNRGYSPDIEASGIYDITRLPKYAVDFYKSQLLDPIKEPFVKIGTSWTMASDTSITVFSNCSEVQIALNDSIIGKKAAPFEFSIPSYKAGKLTAIGYQRNIRAVSAVVNTPQEPTRIKLFLDTLQIGIDSTKADLIFIRAQLLDANGVLVPNNSHKVTFSVIAQDAGLMCPAIQQMQAGIATALLRTEAPTHPILIKANLGLLGLTDQIIWNP